MTKEDMIRMAHEAGWQYAHGDSGYEPLWAFANLVEKAVREKINDEATAHLQELRNNFDVESAELRLHMWSQEKKA
jgi:hypothetical protein